MIVPYYRVPLDPSKAPLAPSLISRIKHPLVAVLVGPTSDGILHKQADALKDWIKPNGSTTYRLPSVERRYDRSLRGNMRPPMCAPTPDTLFGRPREYTLDL
jgi:hypothetical protein